MLTTGSSLLAQRTSRAILPPTNAMRSSANSTLKSFESGFKILVLWMPEYLGNEGNKLLKLIEEPPADTLFILVAENESQILATILSRTQLVKIPALATEAITEALTTTAKCTPEQARSAAFYCSRQLPGSPATHSPCRRRPAIPPARLAQCHPQKWPRSPGQVDRRG